MLVSVFVIVVMVVAGLGLVAWSANGMVKSERGLKSAYLTGLCGGLVLLLLGVSAIFGYR